MRQLPCRRLWEEQGPSVQQPSRSRGLGAELSPAESPGEAVGLGDTWLQPVTEHKAEAQQCRFLSLIQAPRDAVSLHC
jgi:hypothetical protein